MPLLIVDMWPEAKERKQNFRCALLLEGRSLWSENKSAFLANLALFWTKTSPGFAVVSSSLNPIKTNQLISAQQQRNDVLHGGCTTLNGTF